MLNLATSKVTTGLYSVKHETGTAYTGRVTKWVRSQLDLDVFLPNGPQVENEAPKLVCT